MFFSYSFLENVENKMLIIAYKKTVDGTYWYFYFLLSSLFTFTIRRRAAIIDIRPLWPALQRNYTICTRFIPTYHDVRIIIYYYLLFWSSNAFNCFLVWLTQKNGKSRCAAFISQIIKIPSRALYMYLNDTLGAIVSDSSPLPLCNITRDRVKV